jgi:hypothetical protein
MNRNHPLFLSISTGPGDRKWVRFDGCWNRQKFHKRLIINHFRHFHFGFVLQNCPSWLSRPFPAIGRKKKRHLPADAVHHVIRGRDTPRIGAFRPATHPLQAATRGRPRAVADMTTPAAGLAPGGNRRNTRYTATLPMRNGAFGPATYLLHAATRGRHRGVADAPTAAAGLAPGGKPVGTPATRYTR